jgi:3-polyprenyl-4-hydroxybenzoate decarboxylase
MPRPRAESGVVGVTGATGAIYARRLLELLVPQVTAEYRRVVDYLATHGDDDASA